MAKKDKYHEHVKEALIKDGWEITHDPYKIKLGSPTLKIDLGAEKLLAAKKGKEKIAVEIKSFISPSFFTDFYAAVGKILSYQEAIEKREPDRILILAIPAETYENYFEEPIVSGVINRIKTKLLIYNPTTKSITKWIK